MPVKRKQNTFENNMPKNRLRLIDLKNAILSGNYQRVRELIQKYKMNNQELDQERFIHMAVENRYPEITKELLRNGANPNIKDENYPLHWFPIHVATRNGDTEMLKLLHKYGADIESEDRRSEKPIHLAFVKGHIEAAQFLVKNGSNINGKGFSGRTPMYYAAFFGHKELIKMYIQLESQIEARAEYLNTLLLTSVTHSTSIETMLYLIESGANVSAKNSQGMSPLHIASGCNLTEVVLALISKGAEISAQDNYGNTPLKYAVINGHEEMVELILAVISKPDLKIRNKKGMCALDIAISKRKLSIARIISKKMVDSPSITNSIYPMNKLM